MATRPAYATKSGRMSAEEHAAIESLAAKMKNPTPGQIAQKLNRHPATVAWYMLSKGLLDRRSAHAKRPYQRNGKMIYPYSEAVDLRIEQLRACDKTFAEVAVIVTKEFGVKRTGHSIQVRLVQLAADPSREFA